MAEVVHISESEYMPLDLAHLQLMIEELKLSLVDKSAECFDDFEGVVTQPIEAPNFYVAWEEALAQSGFDVMTIYGIGGEDDRTILWARTMASPKHIDRVRQLEILKWRHPLGSMLTKASSGEFHFRYIDEGKIITSHEGLIGAAHDLAPRAYLLSQLAARQNGWPLMDYNIDLYDRLREVGHAPLGFEEIGGLALKVVGDTLRDNPELAA